MNTNQTKQIIRLITIFIFALAGTVHLYGQPFNQSALMNRKWQNQMKVSELTFSRTMSFTNKELINKTVVTGGEEETRIESKLLYYLSDKIVREFQHELVGKNTSGRYIIRLTISPTTGEERMMVHEILELTDTRLVIRHIPIVLTIGGGRTIEFTAVEP